MGVGLKLPVASFRYGSDDVVAAAASVVVAFLIIMLVLFFFLFLHQCKVNNKK